MQHNNGLVRVEYGTGAGRFSANETDYMRAHVQDRNGETVELYAETGRTSDDEDGTYLALVEAILDQAEKQGINTAQLSFHHDEPDVTYAVLDGMDLWHNCDPVCGAASQHAVARMAEAYMTRTGHPVYVSWHRDRDGQDAYLTQHGDHVITGALWEPTLETVSCIKQIVQSGNSLSVNLTAELRYMGLTRGDKVRISLERASK